MSWENRGGGGGPWGGGSGGGGPWGRGGGGQRAPDIEEKIRRGQDRVKNLLPGGGMSGRGIAIAAVLIVLAWLATGFYRVQPAEQGVVLTFGEWTRTTQPGLNWHWPYPIESVQTPRVENVQQINIGFSTDESGRQRDVPEESLMLTGDQNIIDIDFSVQWKIADAGQYLFNIRDPEATVKIAAESAMREIIGRTDIQLALTEGRGEIEVNTRNLLQQILNDYQAGIEITDVQLQDVQPPPQVIDAFNDVQRALQDRDRLRNEADAYRNKILPEARGDAQRIIQEAQAYRERLINEAQGEAQRFIEVYEAYRQNPEVARRRMYLETLEQVMSGTDKVILDSELQGAVPYLPLNELRGTGTARGGN